MSGCNSITSFANNGNNHQQIVTKEIILPSFPNQGGFEIIQWLWRIMLIVYNAVKLCHKVDKEMPPDSYASDLNLDQLKISVNVNKRSLHCKFATKEISSGTAPSIFFYKRSQQSYQKVRSNKCIRWLIGLSVTIIPITSLKKHVVEMIFTACKQKETET